MVSKVLKVGGVCIFGMVFLTGCGLFDTVEPPKPQYQLKSIEAQARGVTVAKNIPYNCRILGEVEGKDNVGDRSGATRKLLRESAINDLRNEAYYVAEQGKRTMVNITKEVCRIFLRGAWQTSRMQRRTIATRHFKYIFLQNTRASL